MMAERKAEPRPITHRSGESALEFLTRHGYEVTFRLDCVSVRLYERPEIPKPPREISRSRWKEMIAEKRRQEGPPVGRVCLEDWLGKTPREAAIAIGWYP